MLTAFGISGRLVRRYGGTSESAFRVCAILADTKFLHSFLIKDAQQDVTGERLKA